MTRKLQRATLKEGQRRSPRISARGAWQTRGSTSEPSGHSKTKSGKTARTNKIRHQLDNDEGPAFWTRGRKKRELRPVEELPPSSVISPPKQHRKQSDGEDIQRKSDQPWMSPSTIFMPEKHILELVLNILQRRDTYKIFVEPVDPKEVEDYYEIIQEPMDFGTMRAKLHEEMYKSLEQFEARTMNELAKKVFSVLKANPENFELEFSEIRQKGGRRNQGDFKDSANVKFRESTINISSKNMRGSSNAAPYRKSFKSNHGQPDIAKQVNARVLENPMGTRESGRYKSFEVDRRCTYKPYLSSPGEDKSIFQTIYGKLKLLEHVNQQDIGYKESLMLFVKDLGQAAKKVVRRKLFECEIHAVSASAPWRPNTLNKYNALNETRRANDRINLEISSVDEVVYVNNDIGHAQREGTLNVGQGNVHSSLKDNIQGSQRMSNGCDKSYWYNLDYFLASGNKFDCLANGSKGIGNKFATILLDKSKSIIQEQLPESSVIEHSQTASRLWFENKCEFQSQSCLSQSRDDSTSSFVQDKFQMQNLWLEHIRSDWENVACSFEVRKILQSNQHVTLPSSSLFNLPYLKTRLDQINSSEH